MATKRKPAATWTPAKERLVRAALKVAACTDGWQRAERWPAFEKAAAAVEREEARRD